MTELSSADRQTQELLRREEELIIRSVPGQPPRVDHDQRLKVLLRERLADFLTCFLPRLAERADFTRRVFVDKETFAAPPEGQRRVLDIAAEVGIRPRPGSDSPQPTRGIMHLEIEGTDSLETLGQRIYEYIVSLQL